MCTCQGPEGAHNPFLCPPQGLGIRPGQAPPTWRCQQRPRCSPSDCPHSPPGTRDHQAPGATLPTQQGLWRPAGVRGRGPAHNRPHTPTLVSSPRLPQQRHIRTRHTPLTPTHQLKHTHSCTITYASSPSMQTDMQTPVDTHITTHRPSLSDSQGRTQACAPATLGQASSLQLTGLPS